MTLGLIRYYFECYKYILNITLVSLSSCFYNDADLGPGEDPWNGAEEQLFLRGVARLTIIAGTIGFVRD